MGLAMDETGDEAGEKARARVDWRALKSSAGSAGERLPGWPWRRLAERQEPRGGLWAGLWAGLWVLGCRVSETSSCGPRQLHRCCDNPPPGSGGPFSPRLLAYRAWALACTLAPLLASIRLSSASCLA